MEEKAGSVSQKIRNLSTRTLMLLFGGLIVFLIMVFSVLYLYVERESSRTITEVGEHYISMLSDQISIHFETIADLRFTRLEQIASEFETAENEDELQGHLYEEIAKKDFTSMAFYTETMEFITLYGESFEPYRLSSFEELVPKGELDISSGTEADGSRVIVFSAPCTLQFQGQPVIALVGTIPVSFFRDSLQLENGEGQSNSYFIRSDGSFVIRNNSDLGGNDSADFYELYLTQENSKEIAALQDAIEYRQDYSAILYTDSWYHLYESPLPHSNWFLITMVPFGTVDEEITRMEGILASGAGLAILTILAAIAIVFLYGFRVIQSQRKQMEAERQRLERVTRRDQSYNQMAMDLQLPVQAILEESQQVQKNLNNPAYTRSHLGTIQKTSSFMLNQLRQSVRLGNQNSFITYQERIYFPDILKEAIGMILPVLALKGQSLSFENHASNLQYAYADPERLRQIFIDTISTASSFTNPNEAVHIKLDEKNRADRLIELSLTAYAPRLPKQQENENRWFYNLENLDRYMSMMDGSLKVESGEFILSFSMESSPSDVEYPKMQGNILLVDPDQTVLKAETLTLEKMGFTVISVNEITPALEVLSRKRADLVLCDHSLSNKVEQYLMDHDLHIPLVSFEMQPDLPSVLAKPFFIDQLDPVLRRFLGGQQKG